jgi:AraC-like DNA-binding protein
MVKKWNKRFKAGRSDLGDDKRSGRPPKSDLAESVKNLLDEFPFLSCKAIHTRLGISKTTCLRILHDSLGFEKLNLRWVPYKLTDVQKQVRIDRATELLRLINETPEDKLCNIITGDESWFFYEIPITSAWTDSRANLPSLKNIGFHSKKP